MPHISRRSIMLGGAAGCAAAAFAPTFALAADTARPALPIPPELCANAGGTIALAAQPGRVRFGNRPETSTYGINAAYLGPAIRVKRGETVVAEVTNNVSQAITMHWHGLIIPGSADGGPHQVIPPGQRWHAELSIDQPAATLWFHPHLYPSTAELVIKGLAGLMIVDDEEAQRLSLPSTWGVDDLPLIIQDRRFTPDGQFFSRFNIIAVTQGYVGDTVLVNGAPYPQARTARGWIRLRILNGSNARSYRLAISDRRTVYVVGSDGGLLETPVAVTELLIHAGERFEILVDARSGSAFDLVTLPVEQPIMRLPPFGQPLSLVTIRPDGGDGAGRLPDALATLPRMPNEMPGVSQELVMNMFRDEHGMMPLKAAGLMRMAETGQTDPAVVARVTDLIVNTPPLSEADQSLANGVNGKPFALGEAGFTAARNQQLRWRIAEGSDWTLHPVHIHGCQFRIVSRDGKPPEPERAGWKDTAPISAGGSTEILVRFLHTAGRDAPYMTHCHILEHEDSGMMAQFTVS